METSYNHLELEDRFTIAWLHEAKQSIRQIAAALDRAPSSMSRDVKPD
jgi:IS30 family transposase